MPIIGAIGNASEYAFRSNLVDLPDPFDFTDLSNVEPGITYYTEYVKITGIKSQLKVTVDPGTLYSIFGSVFDNSNASTFAFDNNQTSVVNFSQDLAPSLRYTSAESFIKNNETIILSRQIPSVPTLAKASLDSSLITFDSYNPRFSQQVLPSFTLPTIFGETYTSTVSIGKSTQDWILKVRDLDSTVNNFSFNSLSNVFAGIAVTSNEIAISGLENNYFFPSQVSTNNARIIVDNVAIPIGVSTSLQNGSLVRLDTTSSSSYSTTKSIDFNVSGFNTSWNVTTEPLDLTPTFTFYTEGTPNGRTTFLPITSASRSTTYNTVGTPSPFQRFDINGLNVGLQTSITFTNGAQYQVIRPGTAALVVTPPEFIAKNFTDPPILIQNGDGIRVQLTSSPNYSTTVTTSATVGTLTGQVWSITTQADPGIGAPIPEPPPPTPPPTNLVGRYYSSALEDHLYTTGIPITSGRITVTDTISATPPGSITLSGNLNPFLGGNDTAFVGIDRQQPSPADPVIRVRVTLPYQISLTSVVLNSNTPSSGSDTVRITGASVTDQGLSGDGRSRVYYVRFTSTNASGRGYARNWSIGFQLTTYSVESGSYFRVFQTTQPDTQLLRTSYLNSRTNHEIAFSNDEEDRSGGGPTAYNGIQDLGYAYPGSITQPSGTIPLYKVVRRVTGDGYDTLVTKDGNEALLRKNSGWTEISSAPGFPGFIGRPYAWVLSP